MLLNNIMFSFLCTGVEKIVELLLGTRILEHLNQFKGNQVCIKVPCLKVIVAVIITF